MKKVALLLTGLAGLLNYAGQAASQPRGSVLELHSCELYAGGCIVSSEATQGGRYMVRAWNFTDGTYAGAGLAGLQVALLQISSANLAEPGSSADQGVVYLPRNASPSQRAALLAWLKATQPDLAKGRLERRVVPLQLAKTQDGYQLKAGNFISVKTASLESCPIGGCGEALWYRPRTSSSLFTVALNRSSQVAEPLLKLKWDDAGRKSVFLAKFGEPGQELYVSAAELCGPKDTLF